MTAPEIDHLRAAYQVLSDEHERLQAEIDRLRYRSMTSRYPSSSLMRRPRARLTPSSGASGCSTILTIKRS
jgi:hypothetical protein